MHLNCSSKVLRIEAADFGESSASICTKGEVSSQRCNLLEVTNIVKTACDNKKNCWITALDNIFGDPCKGVNVSKQRSSSAYLNVLFACGKQISPLSLPWVAKLTRSIFPIFLFCCYEWRSLSLASYFSHSSRSTCHFIYQLSC